MHGRELAAQITFSNVPYAGDDEPRRDESFDFHFPGVQFDSTRRTFFVNGHHGERIPVARFRKDPSFGWMIWFGCEDLFAKRKRSRHCHFDGHQLPARRIRWVETDNNFSLQNLLIALFGDFRWRPDN